MHFTFKPMNERDAHAIAKWHYQAHYTFYDADRDPNNSEYEFLEMTTP